jgi:hypothetical protein
VAKLIATTIKPKIFMNLNFGNLLLDFYRPGDPDPSNEDLQNFSNMHGLDYDLKNNYFELNRLFKSYNRFKAVLNEEIDEPVEYRHLAHILAESNIIPIEQDRDESKKGVEFYNGITIVVLEYDGNPLDKNTNINVRCPPYGLDNDRYENNDIVFITKSPQGFWEPLIYVEKQQTGISDHDAYFRIPRKRFYFKNNPMNPRIVKRFEEYSQKCSEGVIYRGAFSTQTGIDSRNLETFTQVYDLFVKSYQYRPYAIVKDVYNHMVGLSINVSKKNKEISEVIVPVSDDGNITYFNNFAKIHVNYTKMRLGDPADIFLLYNNVPEMQRLQVSNPGYKLKHFKCKEDKRKGQAQTEYKCKDGTIFGFQLANGITLPCRPTGYNDEYKSKIAAASIQTIPSNKLIEFEYEINDAIVKDISGSLEQKPVFDKYFIQKE